MKKLLLVLLGILFGVSIASAGDVELTWVAGPEPDIAGYRIYMADTSEGALTAEPIDAGNVTIYIVSDLEESVGNVIIKEYFFLLTAYDTSNNESGFSPEASVVMSDRTVPASPTGLSAAETSY